MTEPRELCSTMAEADLELLENIARGMPITADLSRSDILLACPHNAEDPRQRIDQLVVVAQAQPHSIQSLYDRPLVGHVLTRQGAPALLDAWRHHRHIHIQRDLLPSGAPIVQHVYPIVNRAGMPAAVFSIETSLIQLERHRQRHVAFRHAIEWLKHMCMRGELASAASLSPFDEWDGVLFADAQRRITYLSGIANNLYRRLGYMEDLRGKRLSFLGTTDDELAMTAITSGKPLEREAQENSHIWIRKALPVWAPPTLSGWLQGLITRQGRAGEVAGVLITVHDATEERRKKEELDVKTTMIQEVHHRVKNNLQTIAAMLRMQARRTTEPGALQAINEAISRILSVAVIHEFLSRDEWQSINIRDVCQRIINQSRQVSAMPRQQITFAVDGPAIYLPSQQATACALVINELIQNAVEHGFEKKTQGHIQITLADGGDKVNLEIRDNGDPLPESFDLSQSSSLGLQIVQTLVQADLHGRLKLQNQSGEVTAVVEFPKPTVTPDSSEPRRSQAVYPFS
jgi:two-component sensor histidine kinase